MGGGSSRRINNSIGAGPVGPVGPRAVGPGFRPPLPPPRYAAPFPVAAPFGPVAGPCPCPCPPRVVSFPPQVRFLPPLPPRIIQLPPKILPVPTPVRCCLPPPPVQCCLPAPQLRCLPAPCPPCLPAPCPPCLPAPCPPCPPCLPGCLPAQPQYAQLPCLPGVAQHQIVQRPYGAPQQYVVPQQPAGYPQQPAGYLQPTGYLQPGQQYIPQQGPYLTAPRSVAVARPVDNALLPSRQIEYVPTPVKQIDYAPPQTLSNRQIAYSGKLSRRSDYDDFDDVAGVRPEGVAADGSARSGKFAFHTPGLDDTRVNSGSPGSRLEYYGENASRAQSGVEYQPQAEGIQYRAVNQASDAAASVAAESIAAAGSALSGAPGTASGVQAPGRASVQYRRVSQLPEGSLAEAPGTASYRIVSQQPEAAAVSIPQAATAAAASVIGQDGQGLQYRSIQNASTPAHTQASVNRGSLTAASLYSAVQNASTPTPSNQAATYRIITQQPDGTTTIREGTTLPSGLQYRVVQSATPSQQYRLSNDDGSATDAELAANASQDEYVEAVSEDGVHYRPVTSQPILTNIKLQKTLTQQSGRPLSALQQYLLNNNSNLSNINELNNGNTYSIARSIGTLSQQQQQQQQQQELQEQQQAQQQEQDQEMIEIPVNVPVKVRIPAPNAANKQQIYNTTIECRQKPYCPERDGSITSN